MILWRDREEKKKAAAAFKPDAFHCYELGVSTRSSRAARRCSGGPGRGRREPPAARSIDALEELDGTPAAELRRTRRAKFRAMGVFA